MRKFARNSDTWEISIADTELLIIATNTSGVRTFDTATCKSPVAAQRKADELVAHKLAEGFTEVDAAGHAKRTGASTKGHATRWQCRNGGRMRMLVLDGAQIVMGSMVDLKCYGFDTPAAAKTYATATLRSWAGEGFRIPEPEQVPRAQLAPAPEPTIAPDLDGGPFDGEAHIDEGRAHIVLTHRGDGGDGPSLAGFRSLLRRIAEAGSRRIRIEAKDYVPEDLWMRAMSETRLPSVRFFELAAGESYGPDLGEITALLECCPNLVSVDLQGGGTLRSFVAEALRELKIWDWRVQQADLGEVLARSRMPKLRQVSIASRTGAEVTAGEARRWLERGAPEVRELQLHGVLDAGGFEGVLTADAPNLRRVDVAQGELAEYLEPIARHGVPVHWDALALRCDDVDDPDEAIELLAKAASLSSLETFELRCDFGIDVADARRRLQAVCPGIDYGGWGD